MKKWWKCKFKHVISNVLQDLPPFAVVDDDDWNSDYLSVEKMCELIWSLNKKAEISPSLFPDRPNVDSQFTESFFKRTSISLPNFPSASPLLCREKVVRFAAMPASTMPPIVLYYKKISAINTYMSLTEKSNDRSKAKKKYTFDTIYIDGIHRLFAAFERGDKAVPLFMPSWQDVANVKI